MFSCIFYKVGGEDLYALNGTQLHTPPIRITSTTQASTRSTITRHAQTYIH